MDTFAIVTDSMMDVPSAFAQERNIIIIPAHYLLDNVEYADVSTDEANHAFYEHMRSGKQPTTSQVNTEQYLNVWTPLLDAGIPILHAAFSSALSGTYSSGEAARDILFVKYPNAKIFISDTLAASCGGTLLVHMLANMRDAGLGVEQCFEWLEEYKLKAHHWFTVDSLDTLKRGGRVSAAAAIIGTMLNIKPVLHVNAEGKLIPQKKVKGRKKALQELSDKFGELASRSDDEIVWLSHGDVPQEAAQFARELETRFNIKKVHLGRIGALVGCHSGPGTMALFFAGTEDRKI